MSTPLPGYFTPHTITVRVPAGAGGMGTSYGEPREMPGFAEDEHKVVLSADGSEIVSSGQVTVNFDEHVPVGSRVTVWAGAEERTVVAISRHQHPDLPSYQTLSLA